MVPQSKPRQEKVVIQSKPCFSLIKMPTRSLMFNLLVILSQFASLYDHFNAYDLVCDNLYTQADDG